MIENLLNMGIKDFRVLDAISQVPRHIFIDEALWSRAYENRSLTIGYKQTISQPYIVAKMTELLISHTKARGKILNNVLELGTGCGYQTAVLSYFCENIYSIERIKPLVNKARENLNELKIRNVELIYGDGFEDWDNTIKYDGVICAAAPREYPHELVDSLNVSAKIVIPVGNSKSQKLNVINKISSNEVEQDLYDDVSFVPMLPGKSEDGLDS
jgi:protein-L-isoaspartate(D-aspartate) O-methyltransferase